MAAEGFKLITILAPEVHDGLGGIHHAGDHVVLPHELADLFIEKKLATLHAHVSDETVKALAQEADDTRRQDGQKSRAEAIMRRHDAQPEAERNKDRSEGEVRGTVTGTKPKGKP